MDDVVRKMKMSKIICIILCSTLITVMVLAALNWNILKIQKNKENFGKTIEKCYIDIPCHSRHSQHHRYNHCRPYHPRQGWHGYRDYYGYGGFGGYGLNGGYGGLGISFNFNLCDQPKKCWLYSTSADIDRGIRPYDKVKHCTDLFDRSLIVSDLENSLYYDSKTVLPYGMWAKPTAKERYDMWRHNVG